MKFANESSHLECAANTRSEFLEKANETVLVEAELLEGCFFDMLENGDDIQAKKVLTIQG